jgi:hypothetical protein
MFWIIILIVNINSIRENMAPVNPPLLFLLGLSEKAVQVAIKAASPQVL